MGGVLSHPLTGVAMLAGTMLFQKNNSSYMQETQANLQSIQRIL